MTEQEKIQELMDMKLHETKLLNSDKTSGMSVYRVLGGWIYYMYYVPFLIGHDYGKKEVHSTFVPEPPKQYTKVEIPFDHSHPNPAEHPKPMPGDHFAGRKL